LKRPECLPCRLRRLAYRFDRGINLHQRQAGEALKRIPQPDDIGAVVAFLASNEARWITGDTLRVDGGSRL
jgi:NAD(P)-dependent dehydrogenase (short-subunit alcohol dehydrogenase family)